MGKLEKVKLGKVNIISDVIFFLVKSCGIFERTGHKYLQQFDQCERIDSSYFITKINQQSKSIKVNIAIIKTLKIAIIAIIALIKR